MKRYSEIQVPPGADGLLPRTGLAAGGSAPYVQIGRASCRERA